jgi:hypothetical protein
MTRVIVLALAALMLGALPPSAARADGCYICRSGSTCGQYCRYSGKDTYKKRRACIKAGCKIGGTASCSSAANIRICSGIGFLTEPNKRLAGIDAILALARLAAPARVSLLSR